jgi:hypothetical protein
MKLIKKNTFVIILNLMVNLGQKCRTRPKPARPNPFKLIQPNSHIEECLRLIETKWQRGNREAWSSYDFEKLNAAIFDSTGVSLSVSTLKRLFGKVAYSNLPSVHTLNTLARFAGFEDWNEFRQRHPQLPPDPPDSNYGEFAAVKPTFENSTTPTPAIRAKTLMTTLSRWWPALLLPLAILFYSLLSSRNTPRPKPDPSQYAFTANKIISEGVPNSVVFHYRSPVGPTDSVFIVQSWDWRRRIAVPPTGTDYSAIYYYPGFFKAKLVVDTQIVRTHDLMITSDGWLALAEGDPVPIYFRKEEVARKEGIEVDSATLERYHLALQPSAPKVRLFYMKDLRDLNDADFSFETTLKTGPPQGSGKCQNVQVLIQCKNDVFIIPLAAKACIGDLSLYAAGAAVSSSNADLSGFGSDLTQWTTLRVTSVHRHLTFFVNGKPAWSADFPNQPEDIVGVQYRFSGTCAVKNARFTAANRTIDLK